MNSSLLDLSASPQVKIFLADFAGDYTLQSEIVGKRSVCQGHILKYIEISLECKLYLFFTYFMISG